MPVFKGGSLIRNARRPDYGGTLGCVVQSNSEVDKRYLLTAAHVIGMNGFARPGDAIEARGPDMAWSKIAEFEFAVKLRDASGVLQSCDAAVARILDPALVSAEITGIGAPVGVAPAPFVDMPLRLRGASSGLVHSRLQSTGIVVPVTYRNIGVEGTFTLQFKDQMLYGSRTGDLWKSSTIGKDSGALVLDDSGHAVGLHLAVTPASFPFEASVCTPIATILETLDVSLVGSGGAIGQPDAASGMTLTDQIGVRSFQQLDVSILSLLGAHNPFGGVQWQLSHSGLIVDGRLERTSGSPVTARRVWSNFRGPIVTSATKWRVPVELILATICTESSGNPDAVRIEPGWKSDEETPHRVSPGLMQTLISTARSATGDNSLDRNKLKQPAESINAGTKYISDQRTATRIDPPLVACAYNAGRLVFNDSAANRWKMRQFPLGTGDHADRFAKWFNDGFAVIAEDPLKVPPDAPSFFRLLSQA